MDYKPLYKQNSLHNSKLDMHINEEKKKLQTSHNFQDENFTSRTNKRQIEGQVFAKPLQDEQMEHFTRVEKKKTTQDIEFISHCLKSHFVFYRLSDSDRKKLAQAFFYCQLSKDDYIIKQGSDASTFFILEQGKVQIIVNKESKRILSPGDGFGELALLYNSKRTASCKSMETCTLWGIDRVKFKHVVKEMSEKEFKENLQFIENVQYFQNLTRQQKDNIASVLIEQKFNKNQDIINEDDIASSFYIIKSGTVSVMKDGKELKTLSKGSSFGESALLTGEQFRTMTIKAKEETFCLALGRDMLTKILGNKVEEIIWRNIAKWTLQKTSFGSSLEEMQIEHLLDHVHVLPIRDGDKVVPKGAYLQDQIVFILQGEVYKIGTKDKVGEKFGRIGEAELLNNINQTQSVDLIGQKSCVIGILKNSSIIKELGCTLKEQVDRNIKMRQIVSQKEQNRKQTLDKLQLRDLKALKHLGAGQFGNVYLVKTVHSNEVYALKCINKQQVVQQHLEKYVMEEKTILEDINFPFIMRFYRSMQDNYHVYLLLEFIEGMELFDVIREMGLLSTFDCQFYIGSIILGIEYMHKNQIIYRDIKPENIMVTNQGYPKIVDLGTAHKFRGTSRTSTIIGTPHYMAPEVLSGKGYSYFVDLWSTGICLYEFMCGFVPFGEDADDPYEIYELIIKQQKLSYPNYVKDQDAKLLMEQLLSKAPELRLGGSYSKLKRHKWFKEFPWEQLLSNKLKAPWVPPPDKQINVKGLVKNEAKAPCILDLEDISKASKGPPPQSKKNPDWEKIF